MNARRWQAACYRIGTSIRVAAAAGADGAAAATAVNGLISVHVAI